MKLSEALNRGTRFLLKGDVERADKKFRNVIDVDPGNSEAWHLLAVVTCRKRRFAEARRQLATAIRLTPGNAQFYNTLGHAFLAEGHAKKACQAFQKALAVKKNY